MRRCYLFFCLFQWSIYGLAQNNIFPEGVYLNFEQLKNKTPAFNADLEIEQRTFSQVAMNGGNEFKLIAKNDSLKESFIKNKIYCYVKNDSIFLNGKPNGYQQWFALTLTSGNFLVFKSGMAISNYNGMGGAIGGGISAAEASKKKYRYVLSLRTGNIKDFNQEYLVARLNEVPELLEKYNQEKNKDTEPVMIRYMQLLNEKIIF